jgi:hypothetical protein
MMFNEPTTDLGGKDLDNKVKEYLADNINRGSVVLESFILTEGFHTPQKELRQAMRRVDPQGIQARKLIKTPRCKKYDAHGPNYLWHLDGCHKLIRYSFVVHACIDGFSRKLVYNRCADNNKHHNHLNLMKEAAVKYGFPCHTRMDKGGENVSVAYLCIKIRGRNKKSFMTGSSKGNVKIERYWRDNTRCALDHYRQAFIHFEAIGLLDVDSQVGIFVLHHLFMGRINEDCDRQTMVWNSHKTRTLKSKSPNIICLLWKGKRYEKATTIAEMDAAMVPFSLSNGLAAPDYYCPHQQQVHVDPPRNIFSPYQLDAFRQQVTPLTLKDSTDVFCNRMIHALRVAESILA